jgi:predicted permease
MRWLRRLVRKSLAEAQLDKELRFHLDQQIADNITAGMSPEEARRCANLQFGGLEQTKERIRDTRCETHLDNLYRDFRYALRALRKNRRFAAVAIFTLALGIGSTTAIFSVIDCVLLRPYPYKNADRLATFTDFSADQFRAWRYPVAAFFDFKEQNHTFEDMIGLVYRGVRYIGREGTDVFFGGWVTPDTFEVLGIKPLLGRPITREDAKPGAPPVFVMSYRLWTKLFHRDPRILGTTQTLNATPMTLIGIMPPRFRFGDCEVWVPLSLTRSTFVPGPGIEPNEVWTVGHLKPGVSPQTATADLEVIAKQLENVFPIYFPPQFRLVVNTFSSDRVGDDFKVTIFALMTAVTMLLFIACSNVTNLLLARATTREKEIVIRASLGATRGRLINQLLVESFSLALASCALGCLFAYLGLKGIAVVIPPDTIPSEAAITLNPAALLFSLGATTLTAMICGLAPAFHSVHRDLQTALTSTGKGASADFRHGKLRFFLVIVEVALSILLLIGSGLMMRSLLALKNVNIGFDPAKVLYARLALPEGRYDTARKKKLLLRRILDRVALIPGVIAAAGTTSSPPYTWGWTTVAVLGETPPQNRNTASIMCTEGYFQTLERHLLRGSLLSQKDIDAARQVVVVNQTFVRQHFGDVNPTGQKIRFSDFETLSDWPRDPYFEIIGVIGDARNYGLQEPPRPEVYLPSTLTGDDPGGIVVRTTPNANAILESIRRDVSAVDPNIALADAETIESLLRHSYYAGPHFILVTLGAIGIIGLLLVAIGVFSVMAYTVSLQTHEIGIRMALGAQQASILKMILAKGVRLVAVGILVGLLASYGLTRFLASQVWGVSVTDPWTFVAVAIMISLVGLTACLLPARSAARVDPLVALRYE